MNGLERAESLAYAYGKSQAVLRDVSADIVAGSFLAILGVNGCGKTTLMGCLDGLLSPDKGVVYLGEQELSAYSREERATHIAYVAQHSHAHRTTVYDALLLGRKPYIKTSPNKSDFEAVERVIYDLHLEDLALRYVDELSGGEYQKIIIARAFVQDTQVLLLDEPTNNLDMANQAEVMALVRCAVDTRNIAAAAVMHDINLALRYCDRFLLMGKGDVIAYGGTEVITPDMIQRVYGITADVIEHAGYKLVVPSVQQDATKGTGKLLQDATVSPSPLLHAPEKEFEHDLHREHLLR